MLTAYGMTEVGGIAVMVPNKNSPQGGANYTPSQRGKLSP